MALRIICVADIHGDRNSVLKLGDFMKLKRVDYVFLMGDYSKGFRDPDENMGDLNYVLDEVRVKVKALPGNCDQPQALEVLRKRNVNLHDTISKLEGVSFVGLGGSNLTPFKTPFEFTEEELYRKLKKLTDAAKGEKLVLVIHFPPKNTKCDELTNHAHVGSRSLRKIIEEVQPELVVCSHIHEAGGSEDLIGKTRVINVGRLPDGNAVIIEVGADGSIVADRRKIF